MQPQTIKILVVDDNEVERTFLRRTLEKNGYEVKAAENGEHAIKIVLEDKPDLILMDCMMPVLGGLETVKRIKDHDFLQSVPVIFLTSIDTPTNIIECFESGADQYLTKPISSKILLSQVQMILQDQKPH